MKICDTHVHSFRTFAGNLDMRLDNIAKQAERNHIDVIAITDHLQKGRDVEELRMTGNDILAFKTHFPKVKILFGVEVCEVNDSGLTLIDESMLGDICLNLVIGGVHETHVQEGASLETVAKVQHEHHMMMMNDSLIEILVHPWWFDKEEFTRKNLSWPDDMSFIPDEYTVELARASKETGTYIEISTMSGLCNQDISAKFREDYKRYYKLLADEGAYFAIGTDAHRLEDMNTIKEAIKLVKELKISESKIWQP